MPVMEGLDGQTSDRSLAGLARLYGDDGVRHLRNAHVAVVGIGGVGSWAVEALARSGVRRLTLIDMDHVAESNINRQIHALTSTLGQAKVDAMAERIASIQPGCEVHRIDDFVEPDNWPNLLPEPVTAVIDACDQVRAKGAMAAWAVQSETLFVTVGAAGGKQQPALVEIADLSGVTHDPLLAKLRYHLRRYHGASRGGNGMGVACVFSRETVAPPPGVCSAVDGSLNCHGYGSTVAVTATFGFCAAGWIMRHIAGKTASR